MPALSDTPTPGVILAGAAALGAYEVGVLSHVLDGVARDLGTATMPPVLSGTSAGAINVAALAAFADAPERGIAYLSRAWSELELGQILRPSSVELLSMFLDVTGAFVKLRRGIEILAVRGGLLDPRPIARLIEKAPIARIADHLGSGHLRGVAISATRVATGEAVVFYQGTCVRPWPADANVTPIATQLTPEHVLASAAIPLMFPTVRLGGDAYCDGGLRQIVPMSPALHLGANRLLVINPLTARRPPGEIMRPAAVTSPVYLAGKALNALFADRVEADLDRLAHTTAILRAGRHRFGPTFERELNAELTREHLPALHEVDALRIEPTHDLGALAADYVTSKEFAARAPGAAGWVLRRLADGDPHRAGDLLAFVLFDGGFTSQLLALGRADARARHEELCALFSSIDRLPISSPA